MEDIHFHHNSAVVLPWRYGENADTSADEDRLSGLSVIAAALRYAKANPGKKLLLAGHTDSSGQTDYNRSRRARWTRAIPSARSYMSSPTPSAIPTSAATTDGRSRPNSAVPRGGDTEAAAVRDRYLQRAPVLEAPVGCSRGQPRGQPGHMELDMRSAGSSNDVRRERSAPGQAQILRGGTRCRAPVAPTTPRCVGPMSGRRRRLVSCSRQDRIEVT